jgi:membrane associated rhomboid family serine protease
MGIADRDYYRGSLPRAGFGHFNAWSVTTWLIVVNAVVFFLDGILRRAHAPAMQPDGFGGYEAVSAYDLVGPLQQWGYFSTLQAVNHLQVWRFFTFQFLHASPGHLIGNMIGMYFFGPIVEAYLGRRRYLGFYLLCGCSGAVVYTLLYFLGPLDEPNGDIATLVGASAGIYGVLVAAAMLVPDVTIVLLFPPIPVQLKYLALIMVGVAAYSAFSSSHNAGGEAAHLGGAALGYLLIRYPHALDLLDRQRARRRVGRRRTAFRDWSRDLNH